MRGMNFRIAQTGGGRWKVEFEASDGDRRAGMRAILILGAIFLGLPAIVLAVGPRPIDWTAWLVMLGICLTMFGMIATLGIRSELGYAMADGDVIEMRSMHFARTWTRRIDEVRIARRWRTRAGTFTDVRFTSGPRLHFRMGAEESDAGRKFSDALGEMIRERRPEALLAKGRFDAAWKTLALMLIAVGAWAWFAIRKPSTSQSANADILVPVISIVLTILVFHAKPVRWEDV